MAGNITSTADALFRQWDGHIVPRSFNAGFVTLSYVVSLIGAAATLELINRRTAPKGKFNHLLLVSAAVTMGGISIWCMHYIGNRAIDLAGGQTQLQIAYSSGFTALSFFVPIGVLLTAFVAIGTNNQVSWWRVASGGALAGAAICGMHYLGNASISNYACIYNVVNVVGSALIAVAASIIALAVFFVFRSTWTHSWWKRAISAVLLAGAVSGMHWCASTGTQYRLVALNNDSNQLSRNTTVIVVICLSVGAALVMAGTAWYSARILKRYANKAQQVVLAAAVFDKEGRVLVSPDGLLPTERITDSFVGKTLQESFTEAHPLFHWMYLASRNWASITALLPGMAQHLQHLPRSARDSSRNGVKLISDHGDLVENYETVFKELFCVAAAALADKMKTHLTNVGILWDEILPTGSGSGPHQRRQRHVDQTLEKEAGHRKSAAVDGRDGGDEDAAERGVSPRSHSSSELGRGSLMFLVRRVEPSRDTEALEAAGYRFAELHQVCEIVGSSMQIKTRDIEGRLRSLAEYSMGDHSAEPGVQLGLFGMRARVGSVGFNVLVQRGARSQLPAVPLGLEGLEPWHHDFLAQFNGMTPRALERALSALERPSGHEMQFAALLHRGLESLRACVDDASVFEDAALSPKAVALPCDSESSNGSLLIAFSVVVPIHLQTTSPHCEFIPLNFFKAQQLAGKDSPHHLAFSRAVHGEMAPDIASLPATAATPVAAAASRGRPLREAVLPARLRGGRRPGAVDTYSAVDEDGNPIPTTLQPNSSAPSTQSGSTLKLWRGGRSSSEDRSPSTDSACEPEWKPAQPAKSFGGIMVSQEISVWVHDGDKDRGELGSPMGSSRARPGAKRNAGALEAAREPLGVTSTAVAARGGDSSMEMRVLAGRSDVRASRAGAAFEGMRDATTFVDELLGQCVGSRC